MSIVENSLQRLKSRDQQQHKTGDTQPLAVTVPARTAGRIQIDFEHLRAQGLYADDETLPLRRNEYRAIRRLVQDAMSNRAAEEGVKIAPVVAITSALPGEGKTYTSLNLALSLASQGSAPVILVDGDIFKRALTSALRLSESAGLTELLENETHDPWSRVLASNVRGLYVLPAGSKRPPSSDLVSAARVTPLIKSLCEGLPTAIVMIDTPPLLLSSETPILTDCAGQVLLVVRAGVTLQDAVLQAIGKIRDTAPIGIVLNGWKPTLITDKKYHGAYYG